MVDIGVVKEITNKELLESRFFPSKVGGKPAWLNLQDLPSREDLLCPLCNNPRYLLLQLYCPLDDNSNAFHRTVFIFACLSKNCFAPNSSQNFIVYRCQVPRENPFYPYTPPIENCNWHPEITCEKYGVSLCSICGISGYSKCEMCDKTSCCKLHQCCCSTQDSKCVSNFTLPELYIHIIQEEIEDSDSDSDHEGAESDEQRVQDLKKISENRGSLQDDPDVERYIDEVAVRNSEDSHFSKFKRKIANVPDQIVRYERGGEPLWLSDKNIPSSDDIPHCEYCGSSKQFEFQVLPQLLNHVDIDVGEIHAPGILDWGTLAVYTCENSCDDGPAYKKEFLWKQDIIQ